MPTFTHVIAAVVVCASVASAQNAPSNEELAQRLQDLQATVEAQKAQIQAQATQLQDLRSLRQDDWLGERRAEEVKSLVREVLADADTRASLAEGGMTAGHNGKNFFLASEDGSFLMRIEGLLQARYMYNHRRSAPAGGATFRDAGDSDELGFDIERCKLEFSGHVFSPRFQYLLRLGVDREDNEVLGERIAVGYQLADGLMLWAGEDKAPFLREELVSPARQLAVDRSLMNEIFTAGYIQGVWVTWDPTKDLHIAFSINDGFRSGEADNEYNSATVVAPSQGDGVPPGVVPPGGEFAGAIHKPFFADRTDFAFTGRIDWKVAGDWQQWQDFTSWSGEDTAIFLGAAVHAEVGETGSTGPNNKFVVWTVDASYEKGGFNVFAAFAGWHASLEPGNNLDLYGLVVQGGYMLIPDKLEPFARFEWIDMDGHVPAQGDSDLYLLTLGANYYLKRHQAKFSLDVVWCFSQIPDSFYLGLQDNDGFDQTLGSLGLRQDGTEKEDQVVIRAQFQLMF